jgi:hypothetical protein
MFSVRYNYRHIILNTLRHIEMRYLSSTLFFLLATVSFAVEPELHLAIAMEGEQPLLHPQVERDNTLEDPRDWTSFSVVLYSDAEPPIVMKAWESHWYSALTFTLILPNGRKFTISRPMTEWERNMEETWVIGRGRCRVFDVNLSRGRWDGFPARSDLHPNDSVILQGYFSLIVPAGKFRCESKPLVLRYHDW